MKKAQEHSEPRDDLLNRLQWLMFLRVVVTTFLLGATVLIQIKRTQSYLDITLFLLYCLIGITYSSTFIYLLLLKRIKNLILFAYIQIIGDLIIETALVYVTGGIESIFSSIYILSIITASILLYREGGITIASIGSILYGFLLDAQYYGILPDLLPKDGDVQFTGSYVLYTILVNIIAFYLVAILSSYLSEQARKTKLALKEKEYDLKELSVLNENILQSLSSGLLTVDLKGRITFFNRSAEEITGYSLNEVRNQRFGSVFHDLAHFLKIDEGILYEGVLARKVLSFKRKDGTRIYLGFTVSPLKDSTGKRTGMIVNFQDLTKAMEMEEHLKRVDRLASIGEMAARIAHEIRNPLASISGSIQLLKEELELEDTNRKLMDIVLRETKRLNRLITDFLLFAKPERSSKERVVLSDLIQETLEAFSKMEDRSRDIEIRTDVEQNLILESDPRQLKQLFWNLFINAGQAMPDGGILTINAHREDGPGNGTSSSGRRGYAKIVVSDTGCGIEPEHLPRIFDPFFTTKEKGTGLGLSVVHRIIEGFNGRIFVDSQRNEGTSFTLWLPLFEQ